MIEDPKQIANILAATLPQVCHFSFVTRFQYEMIRNAMLPGCTVLRKLHGFTWSNAVSFRACIDL